MYVLFLYYQIRGEYQSALEVAGQTLEAAERSQGQFAISNSRRNVGQITMWKGDPALARQHLVQAIFYYDIQQHLALAFTYGQEPTTAALLYSSYSLLLLGYPGPGVKPSSRGRNSGAGSGASVFFGARLKLYGITFSRLAVIRNGSRTYRAPNRPDPTSGFRFLAGLRLHATRSVSGPYGPSRRRHRQHQSEIDRHRKDGG